MAEIDNFWGDHSFILIRNDSLNELKKLVQFFANKGEETLRKYVLKKIDHILPNLKQTRTFSQTELSRYAINPSTMEYYKAHQKYSITSLEELKSNLIKGNEITLSGGLTIANWIVYYEGTDSLNEYWFLQPTFHLNRQLYEKLLDQNMVFHKVVKDIYFLDYHPLVHQVYNEMLGEPCDYKLLSSNKCKQMLSLDNASFVSKHLGHLPEKYKHFIELLTKGASDDYELVVQIEH